MSPSWMQQASDVLSHRLLEPKIGHYGQVDHKMDVSLAGQRAPARIAQ